MASVSYGKGIMASVNMQKVLWQIKLSRTVGRYPVNFCLSLAISAFSPSRYVTNVIFISTTSLSSWYFTFIFSDLFLWITNFQAFVFP